MEMENLLDEIENQREILPSQNSESYCPQSLHPRITNFVPIDLSFTRKFAKKSGRLSRIELEEILKLKITEAIVYREQNAKLRTIVERHTGMIENLKKRLNDAQKSNNDLQAIQDRLNRNLRQNPRETPTVLKIVRDVGLQIYEQELAPGEIFTIDLDSPERDHRNPFNRSPVRTPSPPPQPALTRRTRTKRKLEMERKKKTAVRRKSPMKAFTSHNSTLLEVSEGETSRKSRRVEKTSECDNEINLTRDNEEDVSGKSKKNDETLKKKEENLKKNGEDLNFSTKATKSNDKSSSKSTQINTNDVTMMSFDETQNCDETLEIPTIIKKSPKKKSNPMKKVEIAENLKEAAKNFAMNGKNVKENLAQIFEVPKVLEKMTQKLSENSKISQSSTKSYLKAPSSLPKSTVDAPNGHQNSSNNESLSISRPLASSTPMIEANSIQKQIPPRPKINIKKTPKGIVLKWQIDGLNSSLHADIISYQIYCFDEDSRGCFEDWDLVGNVKALILPMATTLTELDGEEKLFFVVRAVDNQNRVSEFSEAQTWQ